MGRAAVVAAAATLAALVSTGAGDCFATTPGTFANCDGGLAGLTCTMHPGQSPGSAYADHYIWLCAGSTCAPTRSQCLGCTVRYPSATYDPVTTQCCSAVVDGECQGPLSAFPDPLLYGGNGYTCAGTTPASAGAPCPSGCTPCPQGMHTMAWLPISRRRDHVRPWCSVLCSVRQIQSGRRRERPHHRSLRCQPVQAMSRRLHELPTRRRRAALHPFVAVSRGAAAAVAGPTRPLGLRPATVGVWQLRRWLLQRHRSVVRRRPDVCAGVKQPVLHVSARYAARNGGERHQPPLHSVVCAHLDGVTAAVNCGCLFFAHCCRTLIA
jgi:hypothetical protein